ncbi:MAG: tripartite tricarboxylate transporter permease [Deltaproteobacteria bacterium]|jgi:putative tricarboxylic transport membrane protein|nr:tripartite tricarboxylate transporter permease [Deltaproteobacteria bacterium]
MLEALTGMLSALAPLNLLILSAGTLFGLVCGALPGISGTMAVVLLIPITYSLSPTAAFLLLISTYLSAVFSGSISAILFRIPGAPEAVATTLDGYPMAERGESSKALGWAISASACGGIFGTLILITLAPQMAKFALSFGSPEYFALAIAGISVISAMNKGNEIKGFICAGLGLFLATIGIDPMVGSNRFTFGSAELMAGINFIPVVTGLFAISEVMRKIQGDGKVDPVKVARSKNTKSALPSIKEWLMPGRPALFARSATLGTIIGILPGVGATTAAVMAYSEGMRWSKTPEKWGTGIPEGILAPESSNNAAANGALVPLMALGIPGSATTAVMLGAFIIHGMKPGPLLFTDHLPFVYAIFGGSLVANILFVLYAKPFIKAYSHIIKVPYSLLSPIILLLCIVGCYSVRNSMMDIWVMLGSGLCGYVLERYKFPIVSIILGLVLGVLAESEFRRALITSRGDFSIFFDRPISLVLLCVAAAAFILPFAMEAIRHFRGSKKAAA